MKALTTTKRYAILAMVVLPILGVFSIVAYSGWESRNGTVYNDKKRFEKITIGMSREQVEAFLGPPKESILTGMPGHWEVRRLMDLSELPSLALADNMIAEQEAADRGTASTQADREDKREIDPEAQAGMRFGEAADPPPSLRPAPIFAYGNAPAPRSVDRQSFSMTGSIQITYDENGFVKAKRYIGTD